MFEFLQGAKTYLVAAGMVVYALLGYLLGYTDSIDPKVILEALGLAALRAGISKAAM